MGAGRCGAGPRTLLEPRDPVAAARAGGVFAVVGAALTSVLVLLFPHFAGEGAGPALALAVSAALAGMGWVALRRPRLLPSWSWGLVPTVVVLVTVGLAVVTRDGSVSGQIWLCWPVLYAASYLRRRMAWVVLAQVLAGDAVVTFTVLPTAQAITDLATVCATLTVFTGLLVRARDREQRLSALLRERAGTDPVTGLANRRVVHERSGALLAQARRDSPLALLIVDIDHFKSVNDTYGHPAGDAVLVAVADALRAQCRSSDLPVRLGGDELAVLLPGCPPADARARGEAVRALVAARPVLAGGVAVPVSVSIGFAVAPQHGATFDDLYAAADSALYEAKRGGRDQVGSVRVG